MTHDEKRLWLIQYLLGEQPRYRGIAIPENEKEQFNLLRSLWNVRMPATVTDGYYEVQDSFLQEENARRGILDPAQMTPAKGDSRLYLWQGDITTLACDAIVNAANSALLGCFHPCHNCIDNCIHTYAGIQLRAACKELMDAQGHEEPTGMAKITPAYNLPCQYVLHTVGPIVNGPLTREHERLLASCYRSCLDLAAANGVESIAFCCISTGVFMFPNQRAAEIAVDTVKAWLTETGGQMKVIFNVFKDEDLRIYQKLLG